MRADELSRFLVLKDCNVVEAMKKIDANAKGILFVVDHANKLLGAISDGDIRRWLIYTGDLKGMVEAIMNRAPKSIRSYESEKASNYMLEYDLKALPVITEHGIVVDIMFQTARKKRIKRKSNALADIPVVIMAGGKGTRLYPYTKILPKPLIPIGDIPIMERIINKFLEYGTQTFYVTVNYKGNMIKSYFAETSIGENLLYIDETVPMGTAGSLSLIEDAFDKPFIVTNCDILLHADYEELYKYHIESGNELTMVAALKNIEVPYGVINTSENGVVCSMEEKPRLSYLVNTGMYILNPEILKEIPKKGLFHMTDLANKLLSQGRKVGMYPISEDSFLDMGEFEEMHRMEEKLNLKAE